jgi:hypothetical protein
MNTIYKTVLIGEKKTQVNGMPHVVRALVLELRKMRNKSKRVLDYNALTQKLQAGGWHLVSKGAVRQAGSPFVEGGCLHIHKFGL